MKILDKNLLKQGKVKEAILVHSYEEYQAKGGQRDMLDTYAHFKEKAKEYELKYIEMMDMSFSGIPVDKDELRHIASVAQAFWYILHLWFNKPLRVVKYSTFSLKEFNNL